jgi:REP element-mobilizing transposase RayT
MPRKPRIHNPGAVYHVILRGNARQDIFFDAEDRRRFLAILQNGIERYGFRLHGYCLMTNHLHLVIQVGEIPLSRIMQNLSLRYTKWINWSQNRIGHLFHGRYKAVMVEADNYLAQLVAYLHLNPVRAGICENPIDYPWSSFRAYLGLEQAPWLTTEPVLSQFSPRLKRAREVFQEFVEASALEGHRPEFHGNNSADGRVLGNDTFVDEVLRNETAKPVAVTIDNCLGAVCEVCGLTMEEMHSPTKGLRVSEGRALVAWVVLNFCDGTLTELGRNVGRDVTTLSSAVKRLVSRSKKDAGIASRMDSVREAAIVFARLQS